MNHKALIIPTIMLSFTCLVGCKSERAHISYDQYLELAASCARPSNYSTKDNSGEDKNLVVLDIIKKGTANMKGEKEKEYNANLDALTYVIHAEYDNFTYFTIRVREDGLVNYYCGREGFGGPEGQSSYGAIDANAAKEMIASVNTYAEEIIKEVEEERENAAKEGGIDKFFDFMEKTEETKTVLYYKEKESQPGDARHYTYYDLDNKILNDLKAIEFKRILNASANSSDYFDSIFTYCVSSTSWLLSINKNYTTATIFYPYQGKYDKGYVSIYYEVDPNAIHQIDDYLREAVGADNI